MAKLLVGDEFNFVNHLDSGWFFLFGGFGKPLKWFLFSRCVSHRVGFKPNPMGWIMGYQNGFNHLFMFQNLIILNGFGKPLKWFE
jgi:hypothetical protein